jgi:hypothetical protein
LQKITIWSAAVLVSAEDERRAQHLIRFIHRCANLRARLGAPTLKRP